MNTKNMNESDLKAAFVVLRDQVTKKEKYQACIDLGKNGIPVDIRTVDDCLKGKDLRNLDFGNKLLQYFLDLGYQPKTAA